MFTKIVLLSFVLAAVTARDDLGVKYLLRVYEDCSSAEEVMPCLKKKAILFFNRAAKMEKIPLLDGIEIVKTAESEGKVISENDIDATLSRNLGDKNTVLTEMLWDRIASFANSRTIQLSLPNMSGQELGRGIEEGRGKMKKMMGMMMMGAAMKMVAMIPLAIAGLFVLAGKALIVSKIALLLAGIMAIKKLMAQKGGSGGGDSYSNHGWSSGGTNGGWDRRGYDSSELAYSAYKRS